MVQYDTQWTLEEAATLVRENPDLAGQTLFRQIVVSANQFATPPVKAAFVTRLEAIVERRAMPAETAQRLTEAVRALRRGGGG